MSINPFKPLLNWFKSNSPVPESLVITVTTEDYRQSTNFTSNRFCPLAIAIKRQTGYRPVVGGVIVTINDELYRISDNWKYYRPSTINNRIIQVKLQGFRIEDEEVILTKIQRA